MQVISHGPSNGVFILKSQQVRRVPKQILVYTRNQCTPLLDLIKEEVKNLDDATILTNHFEPRVLANDVEGISKHQILKTLKQNPKGTVLVIFRWDGHKLNTDPIYLEAVEQNVPVIDFARTIKFRH